LDWKTLMAKGVIVFFLLNFVVFQGLVFWMQITKSQEVLPPIVLTNGLIALFGWVFLLSALYLLLIIDVEEVKRKVK